MFTVKPVRMTSPSTSSPHRPSFNPGEAAQLPNGWRFSSRLLIPLFVLFFLIIFFVPWTQTITVTGQMSAHTPFERPQDIEAQITGHIQSWHVFERD